MNPFKSAEVPVVLQFLIKPRQNCLISSLSWLQYWLGHVWKLPGQNPEPVVHQLQMSFGLTIQKTPMQKTSLASLGAWRFPPTPSPSLCWSGPVTVVGEALHGPLLLLSLWPQARVVTWPLATSVWCVIPQDMNLSWAAKPFHGLTLFLESADCRGTGCLLYVQWLFPLKRGCLWGGHSSFVGSTSCTLAQRYSCEP